MFDELVGAASRTPRGAAGVGAWTRVENAACARRLAASADVLDRLIAEAGSLDREQWCIDNWTMAAAEVAAAQGVSLGVASHQLSIADELRQRLPQVGAVFAAGVISFRMVGAVINRTRLVRDAEAMAKLDADLAAHLSGWARLSVDKLHSTIDSWVDRYDPAAVRRTEYAARGRHFDVHDAADGSGTASVDGWLFAADAAALDARLEAMAAAVCEHDPRTVEQRRADALGALGHGGDRLACACGREECEAAAATPSTLVIHVVAREESLTDDTPAQLDGQAPQTEDPPTGPAATDPAYLIGKGVLPAPLLAAKLVGTAKMRPVLHPGDAPPQPRYIPSAVLAWFVRCRDLTCRFPGCDEPATRCDLDHTIAYPHGPTQASNLKCLCRKHHLLKTFGGWRDVQHADGTVDWLSPTGQKYTTHPGSRLLFPGLCQPTAAVVVDPNVEMTDDPARSLKMPRRKQTRAQAREKAITDERRHNEAYIAERTKRPF
jgi:hypothetical protein